MKRFTALVTVFIFIALAFSVHAQAVCNAPSSGDWIVSGAEVCTDQTIVMNGDLTISASGSLTLQNVVLSFNNTSAHAFNVQGSVNIQDSTVENANGGFVIYSDNNYIENTTILSSTVGVKLDSSQNTIIHNVTVRTTGDGNHGIRIFKNSPGSSVTNSTITTNGNQAHAIYLWGDNTGGMEEISGNTIAVYGTDSYAIYVEAGGVEKPIRDNTIVMSGKNAVGVHIDYANPNLIPYNPPVVEFNTITSSGVLTSGIRVLYSDFDIHNNVITVLGSGSLRGIDLINARTGSATNNQINITEGYGVRIGGSSLEVNVTDNAITTSAAGGHGIHNIGNANEISRNTVTTLNDSSIGLYVAGTVTMPIAGNIITTYKQSYAVYLARPNNVLFNNAITTYGDSSAAVFSTATNSNISSNTIIVSGAQATGITLGNNTEGASLDTIVEYNSIVTNSNESSYGLILGLNANSTSISFNNITAAGGGSSGALAFYGSGSTANIHDNTFTAFDTPVVVNHGTGTNTFTNDQLISNSNPVVFLSGNGELNFINVSGVNISLIEVNGDADDASIKWWVAVNVQDGAGVNLENANVTARDSEGVEVFSGALTNGNGTTIQYLLTEVVRTGDSIFDKNPHTFEISHANHLAQLFTAIVASTTTISFEFSCNTLQNSTIDSAYYESRTVASTFVESTWIEYCSAITNSLLIQGNVSNTTLHDSTLVNATTTNTVINDSILNSTIPFTLENATIINNIIQNGTLTINNRTYGTDSNVTLILNPEIQITSINSPATAGHGDLVDVNVSLLNAGELPANFTLEFFVDDVLTDSVSIFLIGLDSTNHVFNWSAVADDHTLRVVADRLEVLTDPNRSTNDRSVGISVSPPPAGPTPPPSPGGGGGGGSFQPNKENESIELVEEPAASVPQPSTGTATTPAPVVGSTNLTAIATDLPTGPTGFASLIPSFGSRILLWLGLLILLLLIWLGLSPARRAWFLAALNGFWWFIIGKRRKKKEPEE